MKREYLRACLTLGLILLLAVSGHGQAAKRSPLAPIEDVPGLPRVLLIGDSISIGYTLTVRDELAGVANVHRPSQNCAGTILALQRLEVWLGNGRWDVIHFNWGLHDLKYVDSNNKLTDVGQGQQQAELQQYRKNLEQLVRRLEKADAKLIFATTTPVPEGSKGRVPGDEDKYNAAAVEIMIDHKIQVNDLCEFVKTLPDQCKRPADVHYTGQGSERLGKRVASVIARALAGEK